MKVLLIMPPVFIPTNPYLSTPSLKAYLVQKGYDVKQKDINIEVFDIFFSRPYLQVILDKIDLKLSYLSKKKTKNKEKSKYLESLKYFKNIGPQLIDEVEKAKRAMKDRRDFYNIEKYVVARHILEEVLKMISIVYHPSKIGWHKFETFPLKKMSIFLKVITEPQVNPFIEIYERYILPEIWKQDYDLIGISFASYEQFVPGFTLAKLIKKVIPTVHLTLGGSALSFVRHKLPGQMEAFKDFVDSIIIYEGERPLEELIKALKNKRNFSSIPNLIYSEDSKIKVNSAIGPLDINELPTPDFDGLNLNLYISPEVVLPLLTSRGCYWSKCAFCSIPFSYQKYSQRKLSKIILDLKSLKRKYKTRYILLSDEATHPKLLDKLSSELIKKRLNFIFKMFVRFEPYFTKKFCQRLSKAGFKAAVFGLESINERVRKLMNKGTRREDIFSNLINFSESGIWTHAGLIFSFPTETNEEARESLNFALNNDKILHHVSFNEYGVTMDSEVVRNPNKFGIDNLVKADAILSDWYWTKKIRYTISEGEFAEKFIAKHPYFLFNTRFIYASHILLYLGKLGINKYLEQAYLFSKINQRLINFAKINLSQSEISFCNNIISQWPEFSMSHTYLAMIYEVLGEDILSRQQVIKALTVNPDNPDANFLIGKYYLKEENLSKALKYIERASFLFPYNPQIYLELCKLYLKQIRLGTRKIKEILPNKEGGIKYIKNEFAKIIKN